MGLVLRRPGRLVLHRRKKQGSCYVAQGASCYVGPRASCYIGARGKAQNTF